MLGGLGGGLGFRVALQPLGPLERAPYGLGFRAGFRVKGSGVTDFRVHWGERAMLLPE